jgi:hypothetical protein
MTDEPKQPPLPGAEWRKAAPWTLEEAWENCTGQCGADPWCQVCLQDKKRRNEERAKPQGTE